MPGIRDILEALNETDTSRTLIEPKLRASGWEDDPHSYTEQYAITAGRIVVMGSQAQRRRPKFADYLLRHTRDFAIAVVEAKTPDKPAGTGLEQAKDYAQLLGLKFAYATNGNDIVEFDFLKGQERTLTAFPSPAELWQRLQEGEGLTDEQSERLTTPSNLTGGRPPRYYQEIAINRAIQAILQGKKRVLLTMATGTGKTPTAFQICWKLWTCHWNATGEHRKPRILYLADRNILVDDPKDIHFAPFGLARHKIENGKAVKAREMYFSTYQSIAKDENRPGLYREYPADFFDLIIVDECHRGSARDDSSWREILEYFAPAYQLGLTATPKREETADTYNYFGDPIYTYSLRQGIDDGFLAPYRVHRIVTTPDAVGYRPRSGEVDLKGNEVPDGEYHTKDFDRVLSILNRTKTIAKSIAEFLRSTDPYAKTIVFCVDQEHALQMRQELVNLISDLVAKHPDYVCRVTADEGQIGKGHLSRFQDIETRTPVILTTSQLLTTGVDAQMIKNVVLARVINSMTEFKQIIGRGTRVREDYGKLYFNILDYTGSATSLFADPDFDGEPLPPERPESTADEGAELPLAPQNGERGPGVEGLTVAETDEPDYKEKVRKFYVEGGEVRIVAHLVYELDADGRQLRVVEFTDYSAEKVRTLFATQDDLLQEWANPERRSEVLAALEERGIDIEELARIVGKPEADPFDLLCHVAFGAPLRTRRQRAQAVLNRKPDPFAAYGPTARAILEQLLHRYASDGVKEFAMPDALKVDPISRHGSVTEIAAHFGGPSELRQAVSLLQACLYREDS